MRKKMIFLFAVAIVFLTSCSSTKKSGTNFGQKSSFLPSTPKPSDDGLSYSTAIVIMETSETKGPHAEYEWIKIHYNNYKVKQQSLTTHDKKPYDIITIVMSDDKELQLYFDISNYFGKF